MAESRTDRELLTDYTRQGSERAFQLLAQRHTDLVFATAMRGLNDAFAAQEITQNVFIALARKAAWLCGETNLSGWLHKTTLFEVRHWWRGELRRQRREKTAVELGTVMKEDDSLLKTLTSELDEGLLELRQGDRQALMLRYFEGRTHKEIGELLGAREDAIRMRIGKALGRLTQFFRRRGYAVPAVATTIAVLGSATKAAPAGLAIVAARSALTASVGGVTGLKLLLAQITGLTQAQRTFLCLALVAGPAAWEWNTGRMESKRAVVLEARLQAVTGHQEDYLAEIERLRSESSRLEGALAEALKTQTRYQQAAAKLDALATKTRAMLADSGYRWPDDSAYVRIPKAAVKSLDLLHRPPMPFGSSGELNEAALELFGITAQEKLPTEQALASYWKGVQDLMTATAYETNITGSPSGRLTKTVIVPPLGQPLKTLAEETRAQLTSILGEQREQLLFAGWDEGGIQLFSPGNIWKISDDSQTFTVWVEPTRTVDHGVKHGASRFSKMGGMSAEDSSSQGIVPKPIAERFFNSWLEQFGISN